MPKTQEAVVAAEWATPSYMDLVTSGNLLSPQVIGGSDAEVADKESLAGRPFVLMSVRFSDGDFGPFAIAKIVTGENEHKVLTDGSAGIFRQLHNYITRTRQGELPESGVDYELGIHAVNGLRRSDYTYDSETKRVLRDGDKPEGKAIPATTWYVA